MPQIITLGESMVMMVADQSDSLQFVTSYSRKIAGAESNVAIGLARLGHDVGWISAIGDDPFGTYIRNTIRGEGVDTSRVQILPEYPTGMLIKERNEIGDPKVFYYRRGSAASHITPDMVDESYLADTKILHVTGIFPALSENCLETLFKAIAIAKKQGALITFDPNIRLKLWTREQARATLLQLASLSDLIMPGRKEAELLIGTGDWEQVKEYFHNAGNRYIVMKDGPEGAFYSHREDAKVVEEGYAKGFPVRRVVDTVGAGDGFAVGVLSALLEGVSLKQSVVRGNAIGSLAVTVQGDVEGYPTRRQLEEYLVQE
ncbi:sugar kinase [Sporomusa sp.]|uniref:sugar kinase n=1 Tax=Sporomusa sp. TaxID=2078658 RepID=UPI002CB2AD50|nr:sugar kinase [Sporomusa sp.]HWR08079.1 sugar kinase [Sporomusa sp.]